MSACVVLRAAGVYKCTCYTACNGCRQRRRRRRRRQVCHAFNVRFPLKFLLIYIWALCRRQDGFRYCRKLETRDKNHGIKCDIEVSNWFLAILLRSYGANWKFTRIRPRRFWWAQFSVRDDWIQIRSNLSISNLLAWKDACAAVAGNVTNASVCMASNAQFVNRKWHYGELNKTNRGPECISLVLNLLTATAAGTKYHSKSNEVPTSRGTQNAKRRIRSGFFFSFAWEWGRHIHFGCE